MKYLILIVMAITLSACTLSPTSPEAAAPVCDDTNAIYKTCDDQKPAFTAAVEQAKTEKKILMITFGADWCPWCQSLHRVMTGEEFQKLLETEKYKGKSLASQVAFLNIGVSHKLGDERAPVLNGRDIFNQIAADTKSGEKKIDGIPYLVFLNATKNKAYFRDSANLESGDGKVGHSPAKIVTAIREALKKLN